MPPYVLANIAFRPEERPSDHAAFEMVVSKLAEAIQSQVRRCPSFAWTVGVPGHQLGVGRIPVQEIAGFVSAVFCA